MRLFVLSVLMLLMLTACSGIMPGATAPTPRPTATIAPFFRGDQQELPVVVIPTALPRATAVLEPSAVAGSAGPVRPADPLDQIIEEVPIFDERLAAGWTDEFSFDHLVNLQSRVTASSGFTSLEAVPLEPFGGVVLALTPDSKALWPRSEVLGIRLDISGGRGSLAPYNILFKVLGSNQYSYYVENDTSVPRPDWLRADKPIFDEVGLDSLGLLRDLEVGEWAEVTLWLDEYDQVEYRFVTGMIFFNDELFMRPYYVDNIRLLVRRR